MLNRTRFTQIGELGPFVRSTLQFPVELRQRHHGDIEFLGEGFQGATDQPDIEVTTGGLISLGEANQLQVIDKQNVDTVAQGQVSRLSSQLVQGANRVRYKKGQVGETTGGLSQPGPVIFAQPSTSQFGRFDLAFRHKEMVENLGARHLN